MAPSRWQIDMGAQVIAGGRVRFRVWAPAARRLEVEVYPWPQGIVRHDMSPEGDGVWSTTLDAPAGTLYRYRLNDEWGYPDPYSRSQPDGVHGPSQVIDTASFRWTDGGWRGPDQQSLVIYEVHVGAYTPEGTFDALVGQLDELKALGVTALELMPVAEFPGRRNWGYDGVDLFAPASVYGGPEGLHRLVDAAHARGLGIILDVVYNHLGPDGNYLRAFSPDYFTSRHQTPWGDAINFDGEHSGRVRRFFIQNAIYWFDELHVDGLRLDATHHMLDDSAKHVIAELAEAVRHWSTEYRPVLLIAENERNDLRLVLPRERGGDGLDGLWVDDFHHSVHVLLTGERAGYLGNYLGTGEEIARLLRAGLLYQAPNDDGGQLSVPSHELIYCLQNHDQVGNRPAGRRLAQLVGLERYKAAGALLLLVPCTPLVFMGDEFAASTPFQFFTDLRRDLAEQVLAGRAEAFRGFWEGKEQESRQRLDSQSEAAFLSSRLDLRERDLPPHSGVYRLWRELLRLRQSDAVFAKQDRAQLRAEAVAPAVVGVERWDGEGHRRLLVVNLGETDQRFDVGEQSWLGDAVDLPWRPLLSTAEERFAGPGVDLAGLALRRASPVTVARASAVVWVEE